MSGIKKGVLGNIKWNCHLLRKQQELYYSDNKTNKSI